VFNFFKRLNEQPVCRILRFFLNFSRLAVTLIAVYVMAFMVKSVFVKLS